MASNKVRLTKQVQGVLPVAQSGTELSSFTDGQLLIGNSSTGKLNAATLTAGANIQITNGNGVAQVGTTIQPKVALSLMGGRLSFTTSPIMVNNVPRTSATTLYYPAYTGCSACLYYSGAWKMYALPSSPILSYSMSGLIASAVYDIWLYAVDATTCALDVTQWTNTTTRAVALDKQDGVLVKSGDPTRRYIGSIRMSPTNGQSEWIILTTNSTFQITLSLYNHYNQVPISVTKMIPAASWSYAVGAWRNVNNLVTGALVMNGYSTSMVLYGSLRYSTTQFRGYLSIMYNTTVATYTRMGFGFDANVTGMSGQAQIMKAQAGYYGLALPIGYSVTSLMEFGGTGYTGSSGVSVTGGGETAGLIGIVTM